MIMFGNQAVLRASLTVFGITLPAAWYAALAAVVAAMVLTVLITVRQNKKAGAAGTEPKGGKYRGWLYAAAIGVLFAAFSVAYFSDIADVNSEKTRRVAAIVSDSSLPEAERINAILGEMSLEEKAAQLVQGDVSSSFSAQALLSEPLGAVASTGRTSGELLGTTGEWKKRINGYQSLMSKKTAPIPVFCGVDAAHGFDKLSGSVIYPHNIGIGAANDPELTYEMGRAAAAEMKQAGVSVGFTPCARIAADPRMGSTFECYSCEESRVTQLSSAFARGMLDAGVMPAAEYNAWGGGIQLTEDELRGLYMKPYQQLVADGVKMVKISCDKLEGEENGESSFLLGRLLKDELGFDGVVIADLSSTEASEGERLKGITACALNSGVDMLVQSQKVKNVADIIVQNVENGTVSEARLDDAVSRVLRLKLRLGLFDDPYQKKANSFASEVQGTNSRELAKALVERSLVLLKNKNGLLPLKQGMKLLVIGEAADDIGVQCGGRTVTRGGQTEGQTPECIAGTSILDGLKAYGAAHNVEIITDSARIQEADAVLIALGEYPYSEQSGDTDDISLTGELALSGNRNAMRLAEMSEKPTIALIVAGRNVMITDYINDWDAAVMCYLPGTEGDGVASVLFGERDFTGRLPMPWYYSEEEIGKAESLVLFDTGFGLTYGWNSAE